MAQMAHPELAYSFRRAALTVSSVKGSNAVLARVEQLLVDAGDAFARRRYSEAIALYQQARRILWSQLFPTGTLVESKAWQVDVLRSLVSYGGEWLNVLAVEQPVGGVRPRIAVDADTGPQLGLSSAAIGTAGSRAVADLRAAELLEAQGNVAAARFFSDRATGLAPDLVRSIGAAESPAAPVDAGPGGAGPVVRPGGAGPVVGPIRGGGLLGGLARGGSVAGGLLDRALRRTPLASRTAATSLALADAARFTEALPTAEIPPALTVERRAYAVPVGDDVATIQWDAGQAPAVDDLVAKVYDKRRALKVLPDILIRPERESDSAVALAHAWYYETPLGLAECYHALGDWEAAEQWYVRAAGYQYLNATIEAPYVWGRLATLYRDWGDALFRADDPAAALPVYEKVLTHDGNPGASALFTLPGLAQTAAVAAQVIANLPDPQGVAASPVIVAAILDIHAQLAKIQGGLDFWGHWAANVPIWTFDYLQSVAITLCQLAIGAERDAMTFWEKADLGQLTRLQLTQGVTLANAERAAAQRQVEASMAERDAYVAAHAAAQLRAANARTNAADYAQKSRQWTMHQALSAQLSGGEDGSASQLNALADRMIQGGYSISGDRGTLAAAESLTAARLQREYEVALLNRQAAELDAAAAQAAAERNAANARVTAAQAAANASAVRVQSAMELVAAFDDQRFTPDVWHQLGQRMNQLAQRYLVMALDVAKRMQRSYNFENDVQRAIIRSDYASQSVTGLLAADSLLADVQSFTYDLITSTAPKAQPVRQTISLAQRHPFLFETQFRASGRMEFQTTTDDFDAVYPGTYAGRIEHVTVEVDGIVPPRGLSGTLTNSGISHYRLPAAQWAPGSSGLKHRVQARETLVLSDHDARGDAILVDQDRRRRRIFEGAGVASSWTLELPPEVNELDYASIVDVRLTFLYEARFDPDLRGQVLADLATRPAALQRQRPFPLRWLHPDSFFAFYGSGVLDVTLGRGDFAASEADPQLTELSLLVVTSPRARANGVVLRVSGPGGGAPVTVTTDADGIVGTDDLAGLAAGTALGDYRIELAAADNPAWVSGGQLELDAIQNIALVLGYSFTPRS